MKLIIRTAGEGQGDTEMRRIRKPRDIEHEIHVAEEAERSEMEKETLEVLTKPIPNCTERSTDSGATCWVCVEAMSTKVEDDGQVEQPPARLWRRGLLSAFQRSALLLLLSGHSIGAFTASFRRLVVLR